jgi:hypothetical protein
VLNLQGVEFAGSEGVEHPSRLEQLFLEGIQEYRPYLGGNPVFAYVNTSAALSDLPPPPVDRPSLKRLIRFAVARAGKSVENVGTPSLPNCLNQECHSTELVAVGRWRRGAIRTHKAHKTCHPHRWPNGDAESGLRCRRACSIPSSVASTSATVNRTRTGDRCSQAGLRPAEMAQQAASRHGTTAVEGKRGEGTEAGCRYVLSGPVEKARFIVKNARISRYFLLIGA